MDRPANGLPRLTHEEYFSRFMRIKERVEAIPEIKENINLAFCREYLDHDACLGTGADGTLLCLGRGSANNIYSIYAGSISDDGNKIYLALRLKRIRENDRRLYRMRDEGDNPNFQLFSELGSFCDAFVKGLNPPYFTGLVEWFGPDRFAGGVVGLITEDVTKRNTLQSSPQGSLDMKCLRVTETEGSVRDVFIDTMFRRRYNSYILRYGANPISVDSYSYKRHKKY